MDEWAEFLKARLDEDEETARYAGPGVVAWLSVRDDAGQFRYTTVAATSGDSDDVWCADGRVIPEPASVRVIYDPPRALREVAAGRALLARYEQLRNPRALRDRAIFPALAEVVLACIRDRAAVWDGHPDYPGAKRSARSS